MVNNWRPLALFSTSILYEKWVSPCQSTSVRTELDCMVRTAVPVRSRGVGLDWTDQSSPVREMIWTGRSSPGVLDWTDWTVANTVDTWEQVGVQQKTLLEM